MTASMSDKSDAELAADARMIVAALSRIRAEAIKRGIEIELTTWADGKVEANIERVQREKL